MEKIKALIADDCLEFANILKEFLENEEGIEVVGIADDGVKALEMVDSLNPDILILDIIMPNLDGIGVLEELDLRNRDLKVIMASAIGQDKIVSKAISLGADYFLLKPFSLESLRKRILEYREENSNNISDNTINKTIYDPIGYTRRSPFIESYNTKNELDTKITNMMHQLGIPAHVKGYLYLREAIKMVVNDMSILGGVTKVLYPTIAKKYNTTSSRVERAIRHAIDLSWNKERTQLSKDIFGYQIKNPRLRPTNSEFIAVLAERIRL